jgi:hypothetical protein
MNDEPREYQWDYDRAAAEEMLRRGFDTFSVGVFQWVPKASGKGLKRSTAIRVLGYTADPESVFAKADELCRHLNDAGARADDPPPWLQKQYSVPKPTGLVIPRTTDDLTGAQVRSIREQVMKEELLPLGFVKGQAGTYVRQRGEQIHLIDFQPSTHGHRFTVNLAFHYTFIPPLFHRKAVPLSEFHLLDCILSARLGHFLPEHRDVWFDYGRDRGVLREVFVRCAAESLLVVDQHAERWSDAAVLVPILERGYAAPAWHNVHPTLAIACIKMRLGQLSEVRAMLDEWIASSGVDADREVYQQLIKKLTARLRGDRYVVNWVTHAAEPA